ncbi:hypothetical protein Tco_1569642 [Tanacetum coccineum]
MAEPNNYITATQKNFVSNDNEGRMVEKCIIKIQGKFLEKIRNDAFNGNKGENAYEHINKFLGVVGPIKINGFTQDRLWLSIFPVSLTGAAYEWFTKKYIEEEEDPNETDNALEIFMIEGNLFDFETPLCEAFNEFNCLLKIDIDLFTYDIQDIKTYDGYEQELNNDEAKGTDEPWSEKGAPYQLYDHICEPYRSKNGKTKWPTCTSNIDRFCNGWELPGMVRVGSMTYFQDHRWYDELADGKLKDETLSFKAKIEGSRGDATPGQRQLYSRKSKDDPIPEPSNYKVRRFEMMKYSFNDDEEYITIKESKHLKHSKDSLNAYQELLRLIDDGWVVITPDDE